MVLNTILDGNYSFFQRKQLIIIISIKINKSTHIPEILQIVLCYTI